MLFYLLFPERVASHSCETLRELLSDPNQGYLKMLRRNKKKKSYFFCERAQSLNKDGERDLRKTSPLYIINFSLMKDKSGRVKCGAVI